MQVAYPQQQYANINHQIR